MTNHIVNFAIGIDDEAIIKNITENAEKQIISDLKMEILKTIVTAKYYGNSGVKKDNWTGKIEISKDAILKDVAENLIKEVFTEYKDEIIDRAAKCLADSFKNTKAYKEKMREAM